MSVLISLPIKHGGGEAWGPELLLQLPWGAALGCILLSGWVLLGRWKKAGGTLARP